VKYVRHNEYEFKGSRTELDQLISNGILAEKKDIPSREAFQEKLQSNLEKKGKGKKGSKVKK